jgi:predicted site-specific integrase-resolvase
MNNDNYIAPSKITKQFNITSGTLRTWAESGKIRCIRPNKTGRRIYNIEDIKKILGIDESVLDRRKTISYARVSSNHQKEDLERQVCLLRESNPDSIIIKDIGSGLNWRRQGFNSLLEQIYKGDVSQVVVTYRDRLCRFGFELVEWIFKKFNVKLLVLSSNVDQKDITRELSDDLLAITTVFVARNNGLRAGAYKRERRDKTEKERTDAIEKTTEIN